jgi:hypothetical protein
MTTPPGIDRAREPSRCDYETLAAVDSLSSHPPPSQPVCASGGLPSVSLASGFTQSSLSCRSLRNLAAVTPPGALFANASLDPNPQRQHLNLT